MSSWVCIDASLALRWLLPTQEDRMADSLLERWDRNGTSLIGPPLFNAEVTSTIRLNVYFKKLLPRQGEAAFRNFRELNVNIVNTPVLTQLAWELAIKYNRPRTYDMQYLAVAELKDCELWTADRKLVNSLKYKNKRLRWIGEIVKSP